MHFRSALTFITVLALSYSLAAQEVTTVNYLPNARGSYYIELLDLALEKTVDSHGEYELGPADGTYTQREGLIAMRKGKGIDIMHTMTSNPREMVFRPIRVPLSKGLLGYRLLMVKEGDADILLGKATEEGAKTLTYTQGADWPDTEILRKNGFEVVTEKDYPKVVELFRTDRIDAFPRSVIEIWDEVENFEEFEVEKNIVLQYPAPIYYFVNKRDKELAERIKQGLDRAIADGSFDKLFNKHYDGVLEKSNLQNRNIIKLDNPLLPEDTPMNESKYWFDPVSAAN